MDELTIDLEKDLETIESEESETDQRRAEIIAMYEKYRAGEITRKEWSDYLIALLDNYIKKIIGMGRKLEFSNYTFHDFYNQGVLAILLQLDEYDPYKSMPSTYFRDYINGEMNKLLRNPNESGKTEHYAQCLSRIRKECEKRGYSITDPDLPIRDLQMWLNEHKVKNPYSLATIKEALSFADRGVCSLDEMLDLENEHRSEKGIMNVQSVFLSPEEHAIKEETKQLVVRQLQYLSPLERFILLCTEFAEKRGAIVTDEYTKEYVAEHGRKGTAPDAEMSLKEVVELLSTPENKKRFAKELKGVRVTQQFVRHTLESGLRRIRHSREFLRYNNVRNPEFVLQASDEEIRLGILNAADLEEL